MCAALWELGRLIHDIRRKWSIPAKCPCGQNTVDTKPSGKNGMNQVRLSQFSQPLHSCFSAHVCVVVFGALELFCQDKKKVKTEDECKRVL